MVKITAQMRIEEDKLEHGTGFASGWVEIEDCIKFPVSVRRYIDNETQKEKMASVSSGMQLPPGFKMPF